MAGGFELKFISFLFSASGQIGQCSVQVMMAVGGRAFVSGSILAASKAAGKGLPPQETGRLYRETTMVNWAKRA